MEQPPPLPNTSLFQLNLDASNSYTLRSAASWARVLAVVSLLFGVLFIGLGILTASSSTGYNAYNDRYYDRNTNVFQSVGTVSTIITGLIFIISGIFALNFGNKINRALKTNDQVALNSGFAGIRNYFAFWAILMIICFLLMLIGVVQLASRA